MKRRIGIIASVAVVGAIFLGSVAGVAAAGETRIRVLHASPDAPAVDVYVDGTKALTAVPFGTISAYLTVPAGPHHIQVYATGTSTGAVIDATPTFEADKAYTVAATNSLAKIEAQVIVDDPMPKSDMAQVRAVHLSADAPAVDVAPRGSAADAALVKGLVYPKNTGYMDVKAGSYDLDVRLAGTTTVALALPTLDVADGKSYSVFVIGSAASPAVGGNGLKPVVTVDATAAAATLPAPAPSAMPTVPPTTRSLPPTVPPRACPRSCCSLPSPPSASSPVPASSRRAPPIGMT